MLQGWRAFPILLLLLAAFCILGCTEGERRGGRAEKRAAFSFPRRTGAEIIFLSTQMNPVEEAAKMRNRILVDFPGRVDFRPNDNNYLFSQIEVLLRDKPSSSILIGALHVDLAKLYESGQLRPLDDILASLPGRSFPPSLLSLSRLDGKRSFYVPWMQASYIMVANRKALAYLPKGASLSTLTYAQLLEWSENIFERTGKRGLGFPAGEKGLMHRFFQGYLYPSFTGSTLLKFRTAEAAGMWAYFKDLWRFVNPAALSYSTMADPLLAEDVLVAWDHTARLVKALERRPGAFVAFPAPIGPAGRGFMPVISGLSIPAGGADARDQAILIDYLTQPAIQSRMLRETGFFPVLEPSADEDLPPYLAEMKAAVESQSESGVSIPVLMPIGLGGLGGDFNALYMLTFSRIVLEGGDIHRALDANAALLQEIIDKQHARSWLPDKSDERPCKIE